MAGKAGSLQIAMKIIFFGLGSIGTRHLKLLQEHFDHEIYAYRTHQPWVIERFNPQTWDAVDICQPEVAFICNPTHLHIQTAIECAKRGMHLFIEKPIDNKLDGLDDLLKIVDEKKLVTYVAYNMRFYPKIIELKEKISTHYTDSIHIVCYSNAKLWPSRREFDDVLLELSHEIDYAVYLFGPIGKINGVADETWAEISLVHRGSDCTISLDLLSKDERRYIIVKLTNGIIWENLRSGGENSYLDQLKFFFKNLEIGNTKMMNHLHAAAPLFKQIIEFKKGQ